MAGSPENNQRDVLEKAVQQFIEAQLDGQKPTIEEFVKKYPGLEGEIRRRIQNLEEIDSLFSSLMEVEDTDIGDSIAERDLVGQELGDFEILRLIGAGGMGAVFLARQISLDRDVALKVIANVSSERGRSQQRFPIQTLCPYMKLVSKVRTRILRWST